MKVILQCLVFFGAVAISAISGTKVEATLIQPFPILDGRVLAITDDGYMIVRRTDVSENDEIIRVRQWGFVVEPFALAAIVLGRNIRCSIRYTTDDFIGGDCYVSLFWDERIPMDDEAIIRELGGEWHQNGGESLNNIFFRLGIGRNGCSEADKEHMGVYQHRCQ